LIVNFGHNSSQGEIKLRKKENAEKNLSKVTYTETNIEQNDVSLLSLLLNRDNDENIFLHNDSGEIEEFEQIGIIPFEGETYAILRPIELDDDVAVIFLISPEDEDSIIQIGDEELQERIIDAYNKAL